MTEERSLEKAYINLYKVYNLLLFFEKIYTIIILTVNICKIQIIYLY